MSIDIKKVKPSGGFKSGQYAPIHPEKYIGDIHNIIYRSSWEYRFCMYCDTTESITKWSSEPVIIPYYNPIDKKQHEYNVDFYIKTIKEDGTEQEWILEVKPSRQITKPVMEGSATVSKIKSYNKAMQIYITNQAKMKAAIYWAEKRGFRFGIIDESFLFKNEK